MKLYLKTETSPEKGQSIIKILETLGGQNKFLLTGSNSYDNSYYFIDKEGYIAISSTVDSNCIVYSSDEFLSKYPYNIGEMVSDAKDYLIGEIVEMAWNEEEGEVMYGVSFGNGIDFGWYNVKCLMRPQKTTIQPTSESKPDLGEVSDGYHTFNELYEYRLLYNAAFFNSLATYDTFLDEWSQVTYDVHKSKKHSDGEDCFGGGWFIVMAELPTGQISNHYEMKDWDLFKIPEKEKANEWDGHTPQDVARRLKYYLNPSFPKTIWECEEVLGIKNGLCVGFKDEKGPITDYTSNLQDVTMSLLELKICRDAYWKILNWHPNKAKCCDKVYYMHNLPSYLRDLLPMPTEKSRDEFFNNFNPIISVCQSFL